MPGKEPWRTRSPGEPGDRLGRSVLRLSGNEVQPYAEVNAAPSGATSRACRRIRPGPRALPRAGHEPGRCSTRDRRGTLRLTHLVDPGPGKPLLPAGGLPDGIPRRAANRRGSTLPAPGLPKGGSTGRQRNPSAARLQHGIADAVRSSVPPRSPKLREQRAGTVVCAQLSGHDAELAPRSATAATLLVALAAPRRPQPPLPIGRRPSCGSCRGRRRRRPFSSCVLEPDGAWRLPVLVASPTTGGVVTGGSNAREHQRDLPRRPPQM